MICSKKIRCMTCRGRMNNLRLNNPSSVRFLNEFKNWKYLVLSNLQNTEKLSFNEAYATPEQLVISNNSSPGIQFIYVKKSLQKIKKWCTAKRANFLKIKLNDNKHEYKTFDDLGYLVYKKNDKGAFMKHVQNLNEIKSFEYFESLIKYALFFMYEKDCKNSDLRTTFRNILISLYKYCDFLLKKYSANINVSQKSVKKRKKKKVNINSTTQPIKTSYPFVDFNVLRF